MISLDTEIYVALEPIDLRMSFDLLAGLVRDRIGGDPKCGALFVFFGKRREKLKALCYDKTGFVILYKRLSKGTFRIPEALHPQDRYIEIDEDAFVVLLDGLQMDWNKKKKIAMH